MRNSKKQRTGLLKSALLFVSMLFYAGLAHAHDKVIDLEPGEKIWTGAIKHGDLMPIDSAYQFDFYANNMSNQLQPLLLSNRGLYVWSDEPYSFEIKGGKLLLADSHGTVQWGRSGTTLKDAREYASKKFFPASGLLPDSLLFAAPQYNTWIELTYWQNQKDILKYARAIIENGLPPGVLMIDDTWQEDYGLWDFHPGRFHNPKAMVDSLHNMGFKVMLWICPFVSADQYLIYSSLSKKKAFLLEKEKPDDTWQTAKNPAMIRWWNGVSALLDFTNPEAVNWFDVQLSHLVQKYGIDGFKFDAGDMNFYPERALGKQSVSPNRHCELYAAFGLKYPLNEYRACWKMAGQPLAQRLHDKRHAWSDLQKLIPHMIVEGLVGYTFSCPDLIGGGEFSSFLNLDSYDQDLITRSAQCHVLMPMMQFSVAPWRILDEVHLKAVKKSVELRMKYTPLIMELAKKSAKTGEPIISNLEYFFPGQGLENVTDQFMLGDNVLVAPMLTKGFVRNVSLPNGKWVADDGKKYKGGKTYQIDVPIERLPFFTKE